ncbi:MAG: RHS repeat-associated core domain-containing protein [Saprospiraceae bacterium]|nr:RHS repeat-associated core domain-containing protein [Saprospiraceae bacterium]
MKYIQALFVLALLLPAEHSNAQANWTEVKLFDNNGAVMSQSKTFMDGLGRTVQEQSLDPATQNVLASQPVFDAFGRPVLQTLTAPIFQSTLNFKDKFIEDAGGNNYSWDDFDQANAAVPGSVNKPNPVKNTAQGSLGWYYSDNNTAEPYVPASAFPFSRTEYYNDPLGRVKKVSAPGENLRMGSGHEQQIYYMANAGELYYVFGYKGSAIGGFEDNGANYVANENLHATKTIRVDEDGKVRIEYQTLSGLTIATCQSGQLQAGCQGQKVRQTMYYSGERGVSLHLPPSCNNTLKIYGLGAQKVDYKITDLSTGKLLTPGKDYILNLATRSVHFVPALKNRHLFLRISFDYSPAVLASLNTSKIPDLAVSYELDYDYWALTLYDKKGQPIRTVPPNAINCGYDPLINNNLSSAFKFYPIQQKGPGVNQLLQSTPLSAQPGMVQNLFYAIDAQDANSGPGGGPISSTRTPLSAVSSDNDGIDNAPIVALLEAPDLQTREVFNPNLADPDMAHMWGKVALRFELYGTLKSTGASTKVAQIPASTLYLQASYWYNPQKPAIAPSSVNINPYPGWGASFSVPDNILSNYSKIELRLVDISAIRYVTTLQYDNSGLPLSGEQLVANSLIDQTVLGIKLGVTEQFSSYPAPIPYTLNLTSTVTYNPLGWPIKTQTPDEGETNFIYDTEGKLRFKQNAQQLAEGGRFSYYVYDKAGRVVETGEFNPNLRISGPILSFQPYTPTGNPPNPIVQGSVHAIVDFTQTDWLAYVNHCTQQNRFAYDHVQPDFPTSLTGYDQRYQDGQLTQSRSNLETSWYGYDDYGRGTWVVHTINDLGIKTVNYSYTKEGQPEKTDYQKEVPAERFVHQYVYDAAKRLIEVKTGSGNSVFTSNQAFKYYLHGAIKRSELGGTLQGLDYVYTINGRLKSMNDPTLTNRDPGKDGYPGVHAGFNKDVFGFTLDYFPGDYVRKNTFIETYEPRMISRIAAASDPYNGNIRAMRWQTSLPASAISTAVFTSGMLQYLYKYDKQNQLSEAIFGTAAAGTLNGPTPGRSPSFSEQRNVFRVDNLTYDKTGNIKSLRRQGKPGALPMDDLAYNYPAASPNQLASVSDKATTSTYTDDLKPQAANNYQYNSIGQLIADASEDYQYTYDVAGDVLTISGASGNPLLAFEYNAAGLRQKKTVYDNNGNALQHSWYVYGLEGDLLSMYETSTSTGVTTQTELPVYGLGRIGMYDRRSNLYLYELTDHLGNVRATVRDNAGAAQVLGFADYYPHGTEMPGRHFSTPPPYRFGYQGQETDPETGFSNFDLRQYDGRLGRWFNPDPMGQYHSPYLAMGNNFVNVIDPNGGWAIKWANGEGGDDDGHFWDNFWAGEEYYGGKDWNFMSPLERQLYQDRNGTSYAAQEQEKILTLASLGGYEDREGNTWIWENDQLVMIEKDEPLLEVSQEQEVDDNPIGYNLIAGPGSGPVASEYIPSQYPPKRNWFSRMWGKITGKDKCWNGKQGKATADRHPVKSKRKGYWDDHGLRLTFAWGDETSYTKRPFILWDLKVGNQRKAKVEINDPWFDYWRPSTKKYIWFKWGQ